MVKKILNWTEVEFDNIDENTKHPYLKSFGLGAIEGFIDGAVLMYIPMLIGLIIAGRKINKE